MKIGYKYRIYPNAKQKILLEKSFGCCRFLWNKMLTDKNKFYKETGKTLYPKPTDYKESYTFLKEIDSLSLCNVQKNLENAFERFFKKISSYPELKKKRKSKDSYKTNNVNNSIRVIGNKIKIPKIGLVKIKLHRPVYGKIKNITISKEKCGKYFISICQELDKSFIKAKPKNNNKIGLDLGIKDLYTDSNGNKCENPKFYNASLEKLRRLYKEVSRKQKGSKNKRKAYLKVAKLNFHIHNQRKDYLQKVSTKIINENQVICLESLTIKDMYKDKSKAINRNIQDTGLYYFINCLVYKAKLYDREIYTLSKWFPSSQLCSNCGYRNTNIKDLSIRQWTCPHCGQIHDRDINAAINILKNAKIKVV